MKKLLVLVAAVLLLAGPAFSANTTKEFTASVTFSGGEVTFSAAYSESGAITWNVADINLASSADQWKAAKGYITLTKKITQASGKVLMYQDNKNTTGTASYVAKTGRIEDNKNVFSGLVKGDGNGSSYLPMDFTISTTKTTPDLSKAGTYGTRYFVDKSNDAVKDGTTSKGYYTIATVNGWIADIDGNGAPEAIENTANVGTAYMYVGANFKNVYAGESYGTNHIVFEYGIE